jgi:hypothetical protein
MRGEEAPARRIGGIDESLAKPGAIDKIGQRAKEFGSAADQMSPAGKRLRVIRRMWDSRMVRGEGT